MSRQRRKLRKIRTVPAQAGTTEFRRVFGSVSVSYSLLPAWEAEEFASRSRPLSLDFAFRADLTGTIRRAGGKLVDRQVLSMTGGANGPEGFDWYRASAPSDCVEVLPSRDLLAPLAEKFGTSAAAPWPDLHGRADQALVALAMRVRSVALGGRSTDAVEMEGLAMAACVCMLRAATGVTKSFTGSLDDRRLSRVTDFVAAHVDRRLTLTELAEVAALSPYHFAKTFTKRVGVSPHEWLVAFKMEHAMALLKEGQGVEKTARKIGYTPGHQFRRAFRRHFGVGPADVP